jgi:hypothetical protein
MSTLHIARYEVVNHHELDDFVEALHHIQFKYSSRQLMLAGLSPDDIPAAIGRAMKVCRLNDVDTTDHFRTMYVFNKQTGTTYRDWRMTREGFMLAIMNTPANTLQLARWQWELITSLE